DLTGDRALSWSLTTPAAADSLMATNTWMFLILFLGAGILINLFAFFVLPWIRLRLAGDRAEWALRNGFNFERGDRAGFLESIGRPGLAGPGGPSTTRRGPWCGTSSSTHRSRSATILRSFRHGTARLRRHSPLFVWIRGGCVCSRAAC